MMLDMRLPRFRRFPEPDDPRREIHSPRQNDQKGLYAAVCEFARDRGATDVEDRPGSRRCVRGGVDADDDQMERDDALASRRRLELKRALGRFLALVGPALGNGITVAG